MAPDSLIGGLAPFVLAGVLMAAAIFGGKLPPVLRKRIAFYGGAAISVAVAVVGAYLVARGLSEDNPFIWARGLAMIAIITICLGILIVRAKTRSVAPDGASQ